MPALIAFHRIANVLLQSGSTVPEWILKLPKPSKLKRRQMGKVKRTEAVNPARKIGRNEAIKKRYVLSVCWAMRRRANYLFLDTCRDMIAGSKRRKEKVTVGKSDVL